MMTILVAKDPGEEEMNALARHLLNLLMPLVPFFFDVPCDQGSSRFLFRCTHLAWRKEPPVDISHGQWLNIPDFDAPTQLVQSLEHDAEHVDAVMITPERNGMVGHFGKQVSGSAFTVSGWVQPHGSRYVKATCFSRFCFVDIDDMMGSDLRYNYEKPSELEVACFEVKKLVAGRKVIVLGAEWEEQEF